MAMVRAQSKPARAAYVPVEVRAHPLLCALLTRWRWSQGDEIDAAVAEIYNDHPSITCRVQRVELRKKKDKHAHRSKGVSAHAATSAFARGTERPP